MPKGKKTCPKCDALSAASLKVCSCGHVFKKKLSKKKASPFFKERREFIKRMLGGAKYIDYRLDMMRSEERRVGKECRSRWSPYH